jgi:hypothetical protein
MAFDVNPAYPFLFNGADDDPVLYAALKQLTVTATAREQVEGTTSLRSSLPRQTDAIYGWSSRD